MIIDIKKLKNLYEKCIEKKELNQEKFDETLDSAIYALRVSICLAIELYSKTEGHSKNFKIINIESIYNNGEANEK